VGHGALAERAIAAGAARLGTERRA
jgi:hypothetical protein